jgi:hypothetical protein
MYTAMFTKLFVTDTHFSAPVVVDSPSTRGSCSWSYAKYRVKAYLKAKFNLVHRQACIVLAVNSFP